MTKKLFTFVIFSILLPSNGLAQGIQYQAITSESLRESPPGSGIGFKILVDAANLGSAETRIAELTFPVGYAGPSHQHDAIEIFYVLSGRFGHNVNGVGGVLTVGDVGIVKPGDDIIHSVIGNEPAVVLTIWLPGGAVAPFHAP